MKQRQEVQKKLAIGICILIGAMLLIILFGPRAEAQVLKPKRMETSKAYHDRLQTANSWEAYQNSYKKTMLSNAKESRKQRREQEQAEKMRQRFLAKLERIKGS